MSEIFKAEISEMNMLGNGITKKDGCVIFCLGAVDGDVVEAEVTQVKKNYKIAKVLNIEKPSPYRVGNTCPHYESCGACHLRHISYEHELEIKAQSVENALRRGGLGEIEVDEIICGDDSCYRNKVVFHFSEDGSLGYMNDGGKRFTPITNCDICPDSFIKIANFAKEKLSDIASDLTYLFIRTNHNESEFNVVIGIKDGKKAELNDFASELAESFPAITGVLCGYGEHPEENNNFKTIYGVPYVNTEFCGLDIKVSAASFFQVNYAAAEQLCLKAAQLASPEIGEFGADLYCGTGTMGLVCAAVYRASFITGVEINEKAVADAKENAANNELSNLGYYCGDSADFVKSSYGSIDFAIIDPPRSGCSDKMIKELTRLSPKRIIYVSCSPDTLARDVKKLTENGYSIGETVVCDLFPRTKHVETVALLSRKR